MKLEPFLLNQEYQDTVVLIRIPQKPDIILFDLGYCFRLRVRDIQRVSRVFISHTHIDHFAGFDHMLRLSLDREKTIRIYGPPGIIGNVEGKLAGYTWNLAEGVLLNFEVVEIHRDKILKKSFRGNLGYKNSEPPRHQEYREGETFCETDDYQVKAVFLEHRIPVLAYRIDATPSYNADVEQMKKMSLSPGPWVGVVKEMRASGEIPENAKITINGRLFDAAQLAREIVKKKPGTSITYVADTTFNQRILATLRNFARQSDLLFCESEYLTSEKNLARINYHLTATEAATIASEAEVKKLCLFHFSKRYDGNYHKLLAEARTIFQPVVRAQKYGKQEENGFE